MTNKQLLKRIHYLQNKFIDIKGYSFHLNMNNKFEWQPSFDIFIHDSSCAIIFHTDLNIKNENLNDKLKELKDLVDELYYK